MRTLVYANPRTALYPTIAVFARAGFRVEVVSGNLTNDISEWVHRFHKIESLDEGLRVVSRLAETGDYDFLVPVDDICIKQVKEGSWPEWLKPRMLPVISAEHFSHLASKVGLGFMLRNNGIPTPDFLAVNSPAELFSHAETFGFPVILKEDFSFSGAGTFLCRSSQDLAIALDQLKTFPVLCQRYIDGKLFSVEALYVKGKLIHFAYSEILKNFQRKEFSVSCARRYPAATDYPRDLELWVQKLGAALGVHGFLNIGGIQEAASGDLYFFEADARPNAWVLHPSLFGNCFSSALKRFYGTKNDQAFTVQSGPPQAKVMSIANRLSGMDFFLNRYAAWECAQLEPNPKNLMLRRLKYEIASLIRLRAWRRFRKRPPVAIRRIRGWPS